MDRNGVNMQTDSKKILVNSEYDFPPKGKILRYNPRVKLDHDLKRLRDEWEMIDRSRNNYG